MHAQTSASDVVARPADPTPPAAPPVTPVLPREIWTRRCALRLHQLRPNGEPGLVSRVASELWTQVSRFNPEIAAEIEHDSGYWEH